MKLGENPRALDKVDHFVRSESGLRIIQETGEKFCQSWYYEIMKLG